MGRSGQAKNWRMGLRSLAKGGVGGFVEEKQEGTGGLGGQGKEKRGKEKISA